MNTSTDPYANLKRTPGESLYVEFDIEFDCWAIFGEKSGFCYAQPVSEEAANERLADMSKQ